MSRVIIPSAKPERKNVGGNSNEYYNIRVDFPLNPTTTTTTGYIPIVFNTTRTSTVLERPSDYEVAVVRFYLPSELPIFIWDTSADGIANFMKIGLSFEGVDIITDLIYAPYCPICFPANSVLFYQEFIDMINTAYATAFTALKLAKPLMPTTQAPYMTYDANTKLCALFAQTAYDSGLPNPITIYMNTSMFSRFFPSLPFKGFTNIASYGYANLLVQDNKNNTNASDPTVPAGYIRMIQEYSTLALWNDLQTIFLETDHIPTNPEFEGTANDTTRRILTDFEPTTGINNRQAFQYQPQGALRWYDLKSEYPLKSLDLRAFWRTKSGDVYPLIVLQGGNATIKLRFRNKITGEFFDEG
jgi:hypothetical protein